MNKINRTWLWFVNAAESAFKTDIRYLLGSGGWSVAGQIIAAALSFALSIVISRYVTKDVYGEYKYVLAIVSLLSLFSLNDLGSAILQSAASGFDAALPQGFRANLKWSVLVFGGTLALTAYYALGDNFLLAFGILIGGCLTPFMASASLAISYLSGKRDFARAAIYGGIAGNLVPVAALIATAIVAPNPLALIIVYFAANAATDVYFYYLTLRHYRPETGKRDEAMLTYGKHLSLMGIINGTAQNIDQVLVFHFLGPVELAVYNFSIGIVDQSRGPLKSLDAMMRARFADQPDQSIQRGMLNKLFWLFLFSIVCIIVYTLLAPELYRLLFPTYLESISYSQLYAFTLLGMVTTPTLSYLFAKRKTKALYADNIITSVAQILFMLIGIIRWGLWGLVVARVVARLFASFVSYILYRKAITAPPDSGKPFVSIV